MKRLPLLVLCATLGGILAAQDCHGPSVYEEDALDGYTLMSSYLDQTAILVDMNGNTVNEWPMIVFPAKMLPGGDVMGGGLDYNPHAPWLSPDTTELVRMNWQGQVVWSFSGWDDQGYGTMMARYHHDFQVEDNPVGYYAPGQDCVDGGNILVLAHQDTFKPEISDKELQDDVLYELDSNGNLTGFEWHASDHFDEFGFDDDARRGLYMNPNYDEESGLADYLHSNSASFLGENHWYDQTGDERFNPSNIIFDSRNASFVIIISRATGRVVWRIGPDFSAGTPEHGLGQFQGQHHAHMIPKGLPGEGNILVYDNGGESCYGGPNGYPKYPQRDYSRVIEFNPVTLEIVWEYGVAPGDESFYSQYISSAQRLPNGNTLITVGMEARMLEVTRDHRVVWDYQLGDKGTWVYRAYRIPPEWLPPGVNRANYATWSSLGY